MQKMRAFFYPGHKGGILLSVAIALVFSTAAILGILGYAIKGSQEYNHMHAIARDVAADPNSHSQEEILNSGDALVKMMNEATQAGAGAPGVTGGPGIKLILQAQQALNDVRNQKYIIKIATTPVNPAPFEQVTVTITVLNSTTGTAVGYTLVGTDQYKQNGTLNTDNKGQVTFGVPGGALGVSDTIKVTVGGVTDTFTYTF